MCVCHCRFWKRPSQWWSWLHMNTHKWLRKQLNFSSRSSSTRLLTIAWRCRDKFHNQSGDEMKQSRYLRIQFSDKMEDSSCPTENRCRKSSSREFRRRWGFHSYSLHRQRCDPTLGARHEDANVRRSCRVKEWNQFGPKKATRWR